MRISLFNSIKSTFYECRLQAKLITCYSTSIEAPKIVPMFPAYYIFNSLLILLLLLHLIWTYLILKIAYNSFNAGQVRGVELYKLSRARSLRHFFNIDE